MRNIIIATFFGLIFGAAITSIFFLHNDSTHISEKEIRYNLLDSMWMAEVWKINRLSNQYIDTRDDRYLDTVFKANYTSDVLRNELKKNY